MRPIAGLASVISSVLLMACSSAPILAPMSVPTLTVQGLSPVRLGMSLDQMSRALNKKLSPFDSNEWEGEGCWYTSVIGDPDSQISYMMNKNRLVRIDVDGPHEELEPIKTDSGFSIGSPEKAIRDHYGSSMERDVHAYVGADGSYLRIRSRDGKSAILFETVDGSVKRIRTGYFPAVDYIEGCS